MKKNNNPKPPPENDHLQEREMHAYLDGELSAEKQHSAKTHLDTCGRCRERLQEFQSAFAALEGLPDLPLGVDLAPQVLRSLRMERQSFPTLPLVAAAQAAAAVALLVLSLPILLTLPVFQGIAASLTNGAALLQVNLLNLAASLQAQMQALRSLLEQPLTALFRFSAPDIHFIPLWTLFLAAALLGILGNTLLLWKKIDA